MQIEKIIANIRKSNIGNVLYKAKSTGNFVGVFGLKQRPANDVFLETGSLDDLDFAPIIEQSYKRFRKSIPKDFALIVHPEAFANAGDETFVSTQFHIIDLDLYAYLITMEAIKRDNLGIQSSAYSELFYLDGRLVDYSNLIRQNIYNYSFILTEYSALVSYIYKKRNAELFSEENVEDFLLNFSKYFKTSDVKKTFNSLEILSSIGTH
jgi:hypothetical protein